jgi:hypothetical protein
MVLEGKDSVSSSMGGTGIFCGIGRILLIYVVWEAKVYVSYIGGKVLCQQHGNEKSL